MDRRGQPIGFAAIDTAAAGHGFLAKFYLESAYRGQGIAPQFLAYLEDRFREAKQVAVQLTVNPAEHRGHQLLF